MNTPLPHSERHRFVAAAALAALLCATGSAQGVISDAQNDPQNGGDVALPWRARDKFDRVRFMNESSSHFMNSQEAAGQVRQREPIVFLPPVAPPLNSEIPILAPIESGPPAPRELSAFVGEIFYPGLGTRLAADDLPRAMRARIVAYRDRKTAIQNQIRAALLAVKDADAQTRQRQLAGIAAEQDPKIEALEADAEQLRLDLRGSGVFGTAIDNADPPDAASVPVSGAGEAPAGPEAAAREAQSLRVAAFYQDGLSLDGRRLLLEAAMELESPQPAQTSGARLIPFSPGPSRILVPPGLDPAASRRIDAFLSERAALKAELRNKLHDTATAGSRERRDALAKLSSAQAARCAKLEAQAEEIRRDLASLPSLQGPPPPPSLPPDLSARIADYRRHKVELLRTLRALLVAPSPTSVPTPAPKAEDSAVQAWLHDGRNQTEIQQSNLRVSVADFDRLQNDLISALNREEEGIRESLADYVRGTKGPADRKSVNDLLRDFEEARQQRELWDRYMDLQSAVVMPGLSPGQRRVLFDAGVEQLGLPLPAGKRVE
jgi:hypothetical protein